MAEHKLGHCFNIKTMNKSTTHNPLSTKLRIVKKEPPKANQQLSTAEKNILIDGQELYLKEIKKDLILGWINPFY